MAMASTSAGEAAAGNINPMLLESARVGSWEALGFLFEQEERRQMKIPSDDFDALLAAAYRRTGVQAAPYAELRADQQPASLEAGVLLQGVTPEGNTALHVVARYGDDEDFFKCADMLCGRERGLLDAKNHIGDTPLRCAVRERKSKMVSHLSDLAGHGAATRNINPLLLFAARLGSWKALTLLFDWQDAQDPPTRIPTERILRCLQEIEEPADPDVEEGFDHEPAPLAARELLKGVTPDGDTALHAVASNGDVGDFRKFAEMICGRDWDLLFAKNHNGDTPLHCAARARNSKMVSRLIRLARRAGPNGEVMLVRMQNKRHETALHEAIRIEDGRVLDREDREALFHADHASEEKIKEFVDQQGMTIVKKLMRADSELANYPADGISPLYLAILLEKSTIALTLYHFSVGNLSYSGADGQNALHVAALRDTDTVMIELLLDWNKNLTTQVDKDGSTPLHFAVSPFFFTASYRRVKFLWRYPWCRIGRVQQHMRALTQVFSANCGALYQADKNGVFPIHVAAAIGCSDAIRFFLQKYPDNAGLRDAKGRTFLHVAIEEGWLGVVSAVCREPSLAWILNMKDNDGNTALHLAIQAGSLEMFCALFANLKVNLHVTNNKGETPRDVARREVPRGILCTQNPQDLIDTALWSVYADYTTLRWDKNLESNFYHLTPKEGDKDSDLVKDTTQRYIVAAVLIANMAFGASFSIPGGYRADDHPNGGTPTLAGGYIFDAFIMATALTFICSLLATRGFMLAGIPMINLISRKKHLSRSILYFSYSVTCISIAFALGVYMVLAPVARNTAVVISIISPTVLLTIEVRIFLKWGMIARPLLVRRGLVRGMEEILMHNMYNLGRGLLPVAVIFVWAGFARIQWPNVLLRVIQWLDVFGLHSNGV